MSFKWKKIISKKFGETFIPIAVVEIKSKSGEWKVFYPEIDTGAIVSVFSSADCERLGYELKMGDSFDLKGGLGGDYPSWIHEVELKIGNDRIMTRIAFTEKQHNKQYLGLTDVFDKFDVTFTTNKESHFIKK